MKAVYNQLEEALQDFTERDLKLFTRAFIKFKEDHGSSPVGKFFLALYVLLEDQQYKRRKNSEKLEKDFLIGDQDVKVTWTQEKKGRDS